MSLTLTKVWQPTPQKGHKLFIFFSGIIVLLFLITPILEISKSRILKNHWYRAILNAEAYPISDSVNAGYLDEVVEPEELMTKALEVAKDLATLSHPHYKLTKDLDQKDVVKRINDSIEEMANPF